MLPKSFLAIVLVALNWSITTLAVPSQPMEPRAGAVCSSGLYGELAPILAGYSIAQSFCTSNYPVRCTTSPKIKRTPSTKSATTSKQTKTSKTTATTKTPPTTTQPKTTSTATDPKASAWSKCQSQGANFVSTLCSCIETPKACPVTTTPSPTPVYTCAPDASSGTCGANTNGAYCGCMVDVQSNDDGSRPIYCVNYYGANAGCGGNNINCNSNSVCASGYACVEHPCNPGSDFTCQPINDPDCVSYSSTRKFLFGRMAEGPAT